MVETTQLADTIAAITAHDKLLCVSHVGPDGDAIGSLTGMGWILDHLGKQSTLALQDAVPDNLLSTPGTERIVRPDAIEDSYDLIICLDGSSPDRMGRIYRPDVHGTIPLLVIDHHVTNTYFGTINWVDPECAATCQMLVDLADALEVPLEGPLADSLLTGVVTDTLCFRTSNTNARVLETAMRLMWGGANLPEIAARTLNQRPFRVLRLWGLTLPHVQLEDHIIWIGLTQEQMAQAGTKVDDDMRLSSVLIATVEADIGATFTEKRGPNGESLVECSFRAKPGFNVSDLAYALGGGGHPPASGCTLAGTLESVMDDVVPLLKQERRQQAEQMQLKA